MAIYLVRHGETASNAARVVQTPETPLSALGLAQAERLAARLAGAGIGAILSSDLLRAAMTAERLAAATSLAVELEPLLQERNFGELRGIPYAELPADPFGPDYVPPGGESWQAFHARVDAAWRRLERAASRSAGHLAVVTHGLVCHALVGRLARGPAGPAGREVDGSSDRSLGDRGGRPLAFGNTALTIVEGPPWRVALIGCTRHLEGSEASEGIAGV